jgi:protoporphyrinogen oxidase
VQRIWEELLGDDFLVRPRLSRIYYRRRFFDYPLKPLNALAGLGPLEAARIVLSFARARLAPAREERNFEQWVTNRFGRRLFQIFFETYTEKVWGMKCTEISADWAAQRIRNLDLGRAIAAALFGRSGGDVVTTLIHQFHYPRHGPGMMWERCAARLAERGTATRLGHELVRIDHRDGRVTGIAVRDGEGRVHERPVDHLIGSLPLGRAAELLAPPAPAPVLAAARGLRHRDFLTVVLVVDRAELFPDNWIYVHEPAVRVGRIQNFKNWSAEMVPDPSRTALGLEYFVQRGDELWSAPDAELVELAKREIEALGLAAAAEVSDATVVRVPHAYPVYDPGYRERVDTVRAHLESLANLQMIGRNGQHRYNNQDHSMLTGIYAARNVVAPAHDIWDVNVDEEYHEAASAARGDRLTPAAAGEATLEELLHAHFARFDPVALGAATAATLALVLFAATASVLFVGNGDHPGPMLSLLGHYLFGFELSWRGALLGVVEAGVVGYVLGGSTAAAINALIGWVERTLLRELDEERALDPLQGVMP